MNPYRCILCCNCLQDILSALSAPHQGNEEPLYPGTCRGKTAIASSDPLNGAIPPCPGGGGNAFSGGGQRKTAGGPGGQQCLQQQQRHVTWRFRVPEGETIRFVDGHFGPQEMTAGRDFGDFMVMRGDGMPSYQLSCVVDDAAMGITEVSESLSHQDGRRYGAAMHSLTASLHYGQ